MEIKKIIKRITGLTVGATMLGATVLGAMAVDLNEYPNPMFIKDGKFDGLIVIGADANTQDMLGAMDIISSLQATTISGITPNSTETTTKTIGESFKIEKSSNVLNVGESLSDVKNKITETELPTVLSDGIVVTSGGQRFDYEQEVEFGPNLKLQHFADKDYNDDEPTMGLFIERGDVVLTYSIDFNKNLKSDVENDKLVDLEDRKIEILGEEYDFMDSYSDDSDNKVTSLKLMKGALKDSIEEGEVKTHTINGKEYEIQCMAISDYSEKAKFKINGEITDSMGVGDVYKTYDGMTIGVREVMPNEAGDPTQDMVGYFMGAETLLLEDGDNLEMDNSEVDSITVTIESPSEEEVSKINLVWEAEEDLFVANGDEIMMPGLESLKLYANDFYNGVEEESEFSIDGDDTLKLYAELIDYDVDLSLMKDINSDGSFDILGEDTDTLLITQTCGGNFTVTDDVEFFIVSYKNGDSAETQVLEVSKINNDDEVSFRTYDGTTIETDAEVGDTFDVGETELRILDVDENTETVVLEITSANCDNNLYTAEGLQISLPVDVNDTEYVITEEDGNENIAAAPSYKVVTYFSNNEARVKFEEFNAALSGGQLFDDGSDNVGYIESEVSSKILEDEDNERITIVYPGEETYGNIFIGSKASKVITNGNGVEVVTGTVIEVGTAVLDTDLSSYTNENLIVVGGPAINKAAASLLGLKYPAYGLNSGIQENSGMLKLVEQTNGNVAMIVAGWEAIDTQRACRVVAEIDRYDLSGDEMVVTGTSLIDIDINEPYLSEPINETI